jgi:hypothetical protein
MKNWIKMHVFEVEEHEPGAGHLNIFNFFEKA